MKYSLRKFTVGIVLLAVIVFMVSYATYAAYEVKILINGKPLVCSEPPVIVDGVTLVPMRDIFRELGAEVEWNEEGQFANVRYGAVNIVIYPDSRKILKNEEILDGGVMSRIINDRLMIPLRAVSESLGYNILWSGKDYTASISNNDALRIYFLDSGQSDCIFVNLPDGKSMLIDSGESYFGKELQMFISAQGYTHIDYLIATHPHSDHIGSMTHILENFTVGEFFMPEVSHNTKTFEKMIDALKINGCKCSYISAGNVIEDSLYGIYVLSPSGKDYTRMNNYSAVIKLEYNDIATLFSADAELDAEEEMALSGTDISADVLKIGHHGSATSTGKEYLELVSPKDAVITVGADNEYGFPSFLVMGRLEKREINVWRTDKNGDICMTTDGYIYVIEGER